MCHFHASRMVRNTGSIWKHFGARAANKAVYNRSNLKQGCHTQIIT
jgi:hypothetical protein